MKKLFIFLFILFVIPVKADTLDSYIVIDIDSKRILKELDSNKRLYPASTTKIMTALVAIENCNFYDVVSVGDEIIGIDGSNIYEEVGENFLLQDLLYGMMLRSGNDAATTIARYCGGNVDNFIRLMNEKAKLLRLENTYFENATGLDDNTKNTSTVKDLSLIYTDAYKYPLFKKIVNTKRYKTSSDKKSYYFKNKNDLLSIYNKATGGKTGYTPKAGRLLVSSAENNDLKIVIASHGNGYGYQNHKNMYEEIFRNYKNYKILDPVYFYQDTKLNGRLYIKNSFSYPLKDKEKDKIVKKLVYNKNKKGKVAELYIYLDKDLIHKEDVYLKENKTNLIEKIKNIFAK